MSLTDEFVRLPLGQIHVNRAARQRRQVDVEDLLPSIRTRGVLNPIIITRDFELKAGERRLEASRQLGLATIICRFIDTLDPIEAQIVELEENMRRSDLTWQDTIRAVGTIHQLYLRRDFEWTMAETAESIGLTQPTVSIYLMIFNELDDDRIAQSGTYREAYNIIQRRQSRRNDELFQQLIETGQQVEAGTGSALQMPTATGLAIDFWSKKPVLPEVQVAGPPSVDKIILHQSFLDWAPQYSGPKFNLLHCDFPYGIGLFSSNGLTSGAQRSQMGRDEGQDYDDSAEVYFELLTGLLANLDKLMSQSAHLVFWYSAKHYDRTMEMFRKMAPSLIFGQHPLVWFKSDNAGIAPDVKRGFRHVYETALFAHRGGRQIVRVVSDHYSAPTDKRLHVSTKPEPMLRHFFGALVDEHTTLLDPTCGSGSALRAAEEMGAARVVGMDSDQKTVELARVALGNARRQRNASKLIES